MMQDEAEKRNFRWWGLRRPARARGRGGVAGRYLI